MYSDNDVLSAFFQGFVACGFLVGFIIGILGLEGHLHIYSGLFCIW